MSEGGMDPNNGSVLVKSLEHSLKPCCLNVDYLEKNSCPFYSQVVISWVDLGKSKTMEIQFFLYKEYYSGFAESDMFIPRGFSL